MRADPGSASETGQESEWPAALPAALIVTGPTCSGKSALAMDLAARLNGVVINADSMQVYADLRVLTARPTPADEALIPHALYGVRPAAEPGSVAWWRDQALAAMAAARAARKLPILCGGTGLYLAALTHGLAEVPDVGEAARATARALLADEGPVALHADLARLDPVGAARLSPSDGQRIARAWEVVVGTGRTLADWQAAGSDPAPYQFASILLDPPRAELRAAIATRFDAMLATGGLEEARALRALGLPASLPAMRAHGVPELMEHFAGSITLDEAARRTTLATGQYTKRQATWLRHRALSPSSRTHTIHARYAGLTQLSAILSADFFAEIGRAG